MGNDSNLISAKRGFRIAAGMIALMTCLGAVGGEPDLVPGATPSIQEFFRYLREDGWRDKNGKGLVSAELYCRDILASKQDLAPYLAAAVGFLEEGLRQGGPKLGGDAFYTVYRVLGALGLPTASAAPVLGRHLAAAADARDADRIGACADCLRRIGTAGLEEAKKFLAEYRPERFQAAVSIGMAFREKGGELVPLLARGLERHGGEPAQRDALLAALAPITLGMDPAIPVLLRHARPETFALGNSNPLRIIVHGALDLKPCKGDFLRWLEDEKYQDHDNTVKCGLLFIGEDTPEVMQAFVRRASLREGEELPDIVLLLRYFRSPQALPFLKSVASGDHPFFRKEPARADEVRVEGLRGLQACGAPFEDLRPLILEFYQSPSHTMQAGASEALVRTGRNEPACEKARQDGRWKLPRPNPGKEGNEQEIARELDSIWNSAAATMQQGKYVDNIQLEIWRKFQVQRERVEKIPYSFPVDGLMALALVKRPHPQIIKEAKERLALLEKPPERGRRDLIVKPQEIAALHGLLAAWDVDLEKRLEALKELMDHQAQDVMLEWFDLLGPKALPLLKDLGRWSREHPYWSVRLHATLVTRQLEKGKP